jgi:hypothetical protein
VPFAGGDYEIRIKGRLSESLLAAFEGLTTTVQPVATVLSGEVQDQAALYGLLDRIQSLGLELVELRSVAPGSLGYRVGRGEDACHGGEQPEPTRAGRWRSVSAPVVGG